MKAQRWEVPAAGFAGFAGRRPGGGALRMAVGTCTRLRDKQARMRGGPMALATSAAPRCHLAYLRQSFSVSNASLACPSAVSESQGANFEIVAEPCTDPGTPSFA